MINRYWYPLGVLLVWASVVCVWLWIISIIFIGEACYSRFDLGIAPGEICVGMSDLDIGFVSQGGWVGSLDGLGYIRWWPQIIRLPWGVQARVPLWIPAIGFGCLGVCLRWIHRFRRESQTCLQCGYNLRGLACSICPECGQRLEERQRVMDEE